MELVRGLRNADHTDRIVCHEQAERLTFGRPGALPVPGAARIPRIGFAHARKQGLAAGRRTRTAWLRSRRALTRIKIQRYASCSLEKRAWESALPRTEKPGTTGVVAFLSQGGSGGRDPHQGLLGGLFWRAARPIPARGRKIMAATSTSSAIAPSGPTPDQPPVPPKIAAVLAGLAALTAAVIGLITSFNAVHWTSAQTTLVATEAAALWALAGAVTADQWPQTKKQPVAVAGTVTAFVSTTLSLGIGFAWWQLTQAQNASLISLVTAIVAMVSALAARSTVKAGATLAR